MLVLNEGKLYLDTEEHNNDNDSLFESLLCSLDTDTKFDYGRYKLLESQLEILNESVGLETAFPSSSTSVSRWSESVNQSIFNHYKSLKKNYTINYAKLNDSLLKMKRAMFKWSDDKTKYFTESKMMCIQLKTKASDYLNNLESIEREISSNNSDDDVLKYLISMFYTLNSEKDFTNGVDVYKTHLENNQIIMNIDLCRHMLSSGNKLLTYLNKNYLWEATKSKYLPPDSDTHFKILYTVTESSKLFVNTILELLNQIQGVARKFENELMLLLKEYEVSIEDTFNENFIEDFETLDETELELEELTESLKDEEINIEIIPHVSDYEGLLDTFL